MWMDIKISVRILALISLTYASLYTELDQKTKQNVIKLIFLS